MRRKLSSIPINVTALGLAFTIRARYFANSSMANASMTAQSSAVCCAAAIGVGMFSAFGVAGRGKPDAQSAAGGIKCMETHALRQHPVMFCFQKGTL